MPRIFFAVATCILLSQATYVQALRPSVGIIGSYTVTNNHFLVEEGVFNWDNRKVNFGLELTNKFYFKGNYFFKTGLRYNQYRTTVNAINQIAILQDNPYPFTWERRFESGVVPFLFGKDFLINDKTGDFYLGTSLGILSTSYTMTRGTIALKKDPDNTDLIISRTEDTGRLTPAYFLPTLDFGASYHPFKNMSAFSVGILCSIQLNSTDPYYLQGITLNYSKGETYNYRIQNHQSFINCSVILAYTFGQPRTFVKRGSNVDCPHLHK
ncbi:MAG: hypothetical protein JST06_02305 [Bacteroidetes bacterium]|nr:hypothetical protein [Bacteroidota bacterium]MBS1629338.1 hypothetical protein [Bacteroidota bacterium]